MPYLRKKKSPSWDMQWQRSGIWGNNKDGEKSKEVKKGSFEDYLQEPLKSCRVHRDKTEIEYM